MIKAFIIILSSILVISSLLMILIILMQRPKQEGLGAAFGGGMTDQMFGSQTTNILQKFTSYFAVTFFGTAILLSILYMREYNKDKIDLSNLKNAPEVKATNETDKTKDNKKSPAKDQKDKEKENIKEDNSQTEKKDPRVHITTEKEWNKLMENDYVEDVDIKVLESEAANTEKSIGKKEIEESILKNVKKENDASLLDTSTEKKNISGSNKKK